MPDLERRTNDAYLHLLNQNHERAHYIEGLALAYAHTEVLQVPDRSIRPEVLRPLLKACREGLRLNVNMCPSARRTARRA